MDTYQELLDDLIWLTGQDNLTPARGKRIFKHALNAYSAIVFDCDGRWKFGDANDATNLKGHTALVAGQGEYPLDLTYLVVDQVHVKVDGKWKVLEQADAREHRDEPLDQLYSTPGTPLYYDFDGQSITLYPAPATSDSGDLTDTDNLSLRVLHTRPASPVADLDDEIGIPSIHAEYLVLHGARQLGFRTVDSNKTDIRDELVKWEGTEINGRRSGGKIRAFYENRDEDRPRRIKAKNSTNVAFMRRRNT